jgi:hypothetical protein
LRHGADGPLALDRARLLVTDVSGFVGVPAAEACAARTLRRTSRS